MENNRFDKSIPERFRHIITHQTYTAIVDAVIQYLIDKDFAPFHLENGKIDFYYKNGHAFSILDNLILTLADQSTANWHTIISQHFKRLDMKDEILEPYYSDYQVARKQLRLTVVPENFKPEAITSHLVHRKDFDGTLTIVQLSINKAAHFLFKEDIEDWNVSEEQLFMEALYNLRKNELEIAYLSAEEDIELFAIMLINYAASLATRFDDCFQHMTGKYGTIIAIPANSAIVCSPINDHRIKERIKGMLPITTGIYHAAQDRININFYWMYKGSCCPFPQVTTPDMTTTLVDIPAALKILLDLDA